MTYALSAPRAAHRFSSFVWLSTMVVSGERQVRGHLQSVGVVDSLSDVELIERLRDDDRYLREFIRRHHHSLRRLAVAMLRSGEDADEVVQDTFVSVHRGADRFRGESSPRTWIHTICHRHCLARLRRKRLAVVPNDEAEMILSPTIDHAVRLAVRNAAAALPADLRIAFTLVDVLGFTREEAAHMVGIPGNTMRARVARARVLLATLLADDEVQS